MNQDTIKKAERESRYVERVVGSAGIGKVLSTEARLGVETTQHGEEVLQHYISPDKDYEPPAEIDFARLSINAYKKGEERNVKGFSIIDDLTTDDRVVYKHDKTGHVVIAFRGTNPHDWGNIHNWYHSEGFRDVTSDVFLAGGMQSLSHRFFLAEDVTEQAIERYGKENISVTGHSLGGSQAMHVSRKYGIHAEAYNPHIDWENAYTHTPYYHVNLHVNESDPVPILAKYIEVKNLDVRYNPKAGWGLPQHGIENFLKPETEIDTIKPSPPPPAKLEAPVHFQHGINAPPHHDCSRLPLYLQIQYGCKTKVGHHRPHY
jgi:hypothetical protein